MLFENGKWLRFPDCKRSSISQAGLSYISLFPLQTICSPITVSVDRYGTSLIHATHIKPEWWSGFFLTIYLNYTALRIRGHVMPSDKKTSRMQDLHDLYSTSSIHDLLFNNSDVWRHFYAGWLMVKMSQNYYSNTNDQKLKCQLLVNKNNRGTL